jgi:hypothetical protein
VKRGNLLTDDGIIWGFVDIDLRPVRVVLGHISVREDRFNRTFGHAGITIDASFGVDIKTIRQFVKSFDRTNRGAVGVLTVNAHFYNNVGHSRMTPFTGNKCLLFNERNVNKNFWSAVLSAFDPALIFFVMQSRERVIST